MRVIGFGSIIIEYYFKNGKILGILGNNRSANVLKYLNAEYKTCFFAKIGNDHQGRIGMRSLQDRGIDVQICDEVDEPSKVLFHDEFGYSKTCPYCDRLHKEYVEEFDAMRIIDFIKRDDIIILDHLDESTIDLLKEVDNLAFLTIDNKNFFISKGYDEIIDDLSGRISVISMTENVYNFCKKKYDIDSMDLYRDLQVDMLIINRKDRGYDLIYDDVFDKRDFAEYSVKYNSKYQDMLFSEIINLDLKGNVKIDTKLVSKAFMQTIMNFIILSEEYLTTKYLFKIENYHDCICKDIEFI